MPTLLIATMSMLVAGVSLWGWGWCFRTWARQKLSIPLTIAVGLAAVIALGGALNLGRVAYPRVLDAVAMVGLVLAGTGVWRARQTPRARPAWLPLLVGAVPLVVVGVYLGGHLLPPAAYNIHDDFEKYFAHPVRMLETGTLAPNFLGPLGAETLGGQAFLHAFALAHFPISYLGAVDGFFCLLLCMGLAAFARSHDRFGVGAFAGAVCVVVITPQTVNISALFSGAGLVIAAVVLGGTAGESGRRGAVLLGLVYAGLLALKSTFAVFVGLHLLALLLTAALARKIHPLMKNGDSVSVVGRPLAGMPSRLSRAPRDGSAASRFDKLKAPSLSRGAGPTDERSASVHRAAWSWSLVAALSAGVFLAPWLALHAPLYFARATATSPEFPAYAGSSLRELFLSTELNNYGISQLQTTSLAALVFALAIAAAVTAWRHRGANTGPLIGTTAAGLAACAMFIGLVIGTDRLLADVSGATRYVTPVLIGVLPAQLALLAQTDAWRNRLPAISPIVALGLVALFWRPLLDRVEQIRVLRTPLAYLGNMMPESQGRFLGYNRRVLSGLASSNLEAIQNFVPEGESIGVWIMTPFMLDFARNPIHHADLAGLAMKWTQVPADTRYFLFEYSGLAVRTPAELEELANEKRPAERRLGVRALAFLQELRARTRRSKIVYDDGVYLLMRTESAP